MADRTNPGLHGYSVQEAQNLQLGQMGSIYINDNVENTIAAPKYYVAIQVVEDCKFETLTQANNTVCFGDGGTTSNTGPPGDLVTNSEIFPAGITIYGKWTTIDLVSGAVIAYLGT